MDFKQSELSNRHMYFFLMLCFIFRAISIIMLRREGEIMPFAQALVFLLVGVSPYACCVLHEKKRKDCKRLGECIPGHIVLAYEEKKGIVIKGAYYLVISFYDDGEKKLLTEMYNGDPNFALKDVDCNIYKLNGKYVEADFHLRTSGEPIQWFQIPICKRFYVPFWKIGKVMIEDKTIE